MTEDFSKKISYSHDNLFLASEEIILDNHSQFFKVALPDGNEFSVTIDRLLDIF